MPSKKADNRAWRPEVMVAMIGIVGVITAALIANVDKWWPNRSSVQNANVSKENASPRPGVPAEVKNDNGVIEDKIKGTKNVVIMDNVLLTYNKARGKTGRTNHDEIAEALKDMGLGFKYIYTNLNWNDYSKLTDPKPDLIIIHVSSFYDKTNPDDKGDKFRTFLESAMPSLPNTKVLVYSRAFQEITRSDVERYAAASKIPHLMERIRFFKAEPGSRKDYFNDMVTATKLRTMVNDLIN